MKISATRGFAVPHARRLQGATAAIPAGTDWPPALPALEQQFLDATNAFRAKHGAGPVAFLATLQASAEWKARDMAEFEYMAHDDVPGSVPGMPQGRSIGERISDNGYVGAWGENLCYGTDVTPQQALDMLVSAGPGEGHYDNIVDPGWTVCGMGVSRDRTVGNVFYSQDFGIAPASGPRPVVTSISPGAGAVGSSVTLGGANLERTSAVVFPQNVHAVFVARSGSLVQATVPVGAVSGPVVVVTPGGFAGSPSFVVGGSVPPPHDPPPATHERPAKNDTWASKANTKATVHVDAVFEKRGIPKVTYTNRKSIQITTTEARFLTLFQFVKAAP